MSEPSEQPELPLMTVHVASGNGIKVGAVSRGLYAVHGPNAVFDVQSCPVELQEGEDVNAQPDGIRQTTEYAHRRIDAMKAEFGDVDMHVAIESGAERGKNGLHDASDVAVVVIELRDGSRQTFSSQRVKFPVIPGPGGVDQYPLVIANSRPGGFKTTTGGDVVAELSGCSNTDWQASVPGPEGVPLPRAEQLVNTFIANATELAAFVGHAIESRQLGNDHGPELG